jgi:hypothetical protein
MTYQLTWTPNEKSKIAREAHKLHLRLKPSTKRERPWKNLFLQISRDIMERLEQAEKLDDREVELAVRELEALVIGIGISREICNLTSGDSKQASCTGDCLDEYYVHVDENCNGAGPNWICNCCTLPNLTYVGCVADCILD